MRSSTLPTLAAAILFSVAGVASAQQRQGTPMQNMPGMNQPGGGGMDMNAMMARCAQVRQQARPGAAVSAETQRTLAQCDQMDRSMGMTPAPRR